MKEYDVIDSIWFTSGQTVTGIVWVKTEYDGIRTFIGTALHGLDKGDDEQHIAAWGATFDVDYIKEIDTSIRERNSHENA